jgi:hypothetical protein
VSLGIFSEASDKSVPGVDSASKNEYQDIPGPVMGILYLYIWEKNWIIMIWKGDRKPVTLFRALSRHMPGGTEENHKNSQSEALPLKTTYTYYFGKGKNRGVFRVHAMRANR